MPNLDDLRKEFYEKLESMTKEDWVDWDLRREKDREFRLAKLEAQARLRLVTLELENILDKYVVFDGKIKSMENANSDVGANSSKISFQLIASKYSHDQQSNFQTTATTYGKVHFSFSKSSIPEDQKAA